jgi:hypothetical protein
VVASRVVCRQLPTGCPQPARKRVR